MSYSINRVTVIGAGAMGAAIAAHAANAGITVNLLDVVPQELTPDEQSRGLTLDEPSVRNRIVTEGWNRCVKARPSNLFVPVAAERVTVGNVEDDFDCVGRADWIVEAVVERLEPKRQLMARIEKERKPGSIVSTNTSGIPINEIAEGRSEEYKAHFLGTHFFNPPRYLRLMELIPSKETRPEIVEFMKMFATRSLGKHVVVCRDTPSFLANRYLAFVMSHMLNYALAEGFTVEEVDSLTGPIVGRPKTATFRLLDLVGLDIVAHVNDNLYPAVPDDLFRNELRGERASQLVRGMVERGWLGNKTGQGFYKEEKKFGGRRFLMLDPHIMEYKAQVKPTFDSVEQSRQVTDPGERIRSICEAEDRAGRFTWKTTSFGCNYAASLIPEVAGDIQSVDNVVRWGFGHELGPFETWDALGVPGSVKRMEADGLKVAPWVRDMLKAGHTTFYRRENGALLCYDPVVGGYVKGETDSRYIPLKTVKADGNRVIAENSSAGLIDIGDGVICLEFHSKVNALDQNVFEMMERGREELEKDWAGMVIGNQGPHFCAGADLNMFIEQAGKKEWGTMDVLIRKAQDLMLSFRYCPKPVVSAPFNMVLGGGAEVMMEASAICAAAETYAGQVEAAVGVVPALGGCKELLRRVVSPIVKKSPNIDALPFLRHVFEKVAMAKVSGSAEEARQWGFLTPTDRTVMNQSHLLHEAKRMVLDMVESGWRPEVRGREIWAMGATGLAVLEVGITGFREAGYISDHDALIARKTALILCGGRLSRPQWVDPQVILDLERESFLSLLGTQRTVDRITHMLKTGKPLRN